METTIQGKNELFIMEPKYFFKGGQGKLYFATGKKSNLKVVVKEYLDHKSKIGFLLFLSKTSIILFLCVSTMCYKSFEFFLS